MNKRFVLAQLAKIANELDRNNLFSEANDVTDVMKNVEKKPFNPRADPFDEKPEAEERPYPILDMYGVWYSGKDGRLRDYAGYPKGRLHPKYEETEYEEMGGPERMPKPTPGDRTPFPYPYPTFPDRTTVPEPPDNEEMGGPSEEMGSPSNNAVVEQSLDEDVIVRYPGPTGKRHIIMWNVKTPAWPGQEITVDWENNRLLKILDTDEYQKRQNVEIMKSPRKMDR